MTMGNAEAPLPTFAPHLDILPPAQRALADPIQFLAHVMVFGTVEDLNALRGIVSKDEYREVLEHAPPGIFDARS